MRSRYIPHFTALRRARFLTIAFVLALIDVGILTAQSPNSVTIKAVDYAFQSPDTISAGPTLFTFENHGTVRHEVAISRLKAGHSFAEVLAAKTPAERNDALDGLVGILLSGPGTSPLGQLFATMETGRSYILVCTLRDAPDKPPHITQGMARPLYVR